MRRHDLRHGYAKAMLVFVVEERKAIEPNHAVCDAAVAEAVTDGFCDANNDHGGEDVGECAGELEHDDHDGNGDVHDSGKGGAGAEEGVGAGCDAGDVWCAGGEEAGVREGFVEGLDQDADGAAEGGADGHRGDEDAGWDFAAVGNYDEEHANDGSEQEGEDECPAI